MEDGCQRRIANAVKSQAAQAQFEAGLCYLYGSGVAQDRVAAQAWLEKAAAQNHLHARRTLTALANIENAPHPPAHHCHDLGYGRQLCHGGPPPKESSSDTKN